MSNQEWPCDIMRKNDQKTSAILCIAQRDTRQDSGLALSDTFSTVHCTLVETKQEFVISM